MGFIFEMIKNEMGFIFVMIKNAIWGAFLGLLPLLFLIASGVLGVMALLGIVSVKIFLIVLGLFFISFVFMYWTCYLEITGTYEEGDDRIKKWKKRLLYFNVFVFPLWFAAFCSTLN